MWNKIIWFECYKRLSEYLLWEQYKNDPIFPNVFTKKKTKSSFVIVIVYVLDKKNYWNFLRAPEDR